MIANNAIRHAVELKLWAGIAHRLTASQPHKHAKARRGPQGMASPFQGLPR